MHTFTFARLHHCSKCLNEVCFFLSIGPDRSFFLFENFGRCYFLSSLFKIFSSNVRSSLIYLTLCVLSFFNRLHFGWSTLRCCFFSKRVYQRINNVIKSLNLVNGIISILMSIPRSANKNHYTYMWRKANRIEQRKCWCCRHYMAAEMVK